MAISSWHRRFLAALAGPRSVFWVYFLCFASRLLYVLLKSETLARGGMEYESVVNNVLHMGRWMYKPMDHCFPTAYMPPGIIALSVVVKKIALNGFYPLLAALHIALAVGALGLLRRAARFLFGEEAAGAAGWLYLLDINLLIPLAWWNETIFTMLLVLLSLVLALRALKELSVPFAAAAGFSFGIGCLFRSTLVVHVFVTALWLAGLAAAKERRRKALLALGIFLLSAGIAVAPWMVRNALVFKKFIPISQNLGNNLWQGWSPASGGSEYAFDGSELTFPAPLLERMRGARTEPELNKILVDASLAAAKENPLRWVRQRLLSFFYFWHEHNFWAPRSPFRTRAWLTLGFLNLFFLVLFFRSLPVALKDRGWAWYPFTLLLGHSFLHGLIHADIGSRFRYQVEPLMLLLLAAALIKKARPPVSEGRASVEGNA